MVIMTTNLDSLSLTPPPMDEVDMGSQISSLKVEKRKIRSELNAVEMNLKESQKQLADALGGADALDVVANGMRRMEEKISEQLAAFGQLQLHSETTGAECRRLKMEVESLVERGKQYDEAAREDQRDRVHKETELRHKLFEAESGHRKTEQRSEKEKASLESQCSELKQTIATLEISSVEMHEHLHLQKLLMKAEAKVSELEGELIKANGPYMQRRRREAEFSAMMQVANAKLSTEINAHTRLKRLAEEAGLFQRGLNTKPGDGDKENRPVPTSDKPFLLPRIRKLESEIAKSRARGGPVRERRELLTKAGADLDARADELQQRRALLYGDVVNATRGWHMVCNVLNDVQASMRSADVFDPFVTGVKRAMKKLRITLRQQNYLDPTQILEGTLAPLLSPACLGTQRVNKEEFALICYGGPPCPRWEGLLCTIRSTPAADSFFCQVMSWI